ncbi:MAG: hypothetical protein EPN82_15245 [Bacteroidetes bacterium]|nr:MAG: hypothetical protein EPN82_15245 [Bacteroidota bacterium]
MALSVSSISNSSYISSVYEPQPAYRPVSEGIKSIAPIDAKGNQQIPQDRFTPSNTPGKSTDDKSNETYNSSGIKITLAKSNNVNILNRNPTDKQQGVKGEQSPDVKLTIADLEKRDREVRAHENAHKVVGGGLVKGGTSFTYTTGPDGKQYATGGEVQIDISPVKGDPEATIQKMNQVRAAALAPADPSPQDRSVAALASAIAASARAELSSQKSGNTTSGIKQNEKIIKSYLNNEINNNSSHTYQQYSISAGSIASLKKFEQ